MLMMLHTNMVSKLRGRIDSFNYPLADLYLSFFTVWFATAERSGLTGPLFVQGLIPFAASLAFAVAGLVLIADLPQAARRLGVLTLGFVACGTCLVAQVTCIWQTVIAGYIAGVMMLTLMVFLIVRPRCLKVSTLISLLLAGLLGFVIFELSITMLYSNIIIFIISELILMIGALISICFIEKKPQFVSSGGVNELESQVRFTARQKGLTTREGEVVALLARGYPLPTVCKRLGIALGTGDTHIKNIYHKLNVHSREEMIDLLTQDKKN